MILLTAFAWLVALLGGDVAAVLAASQSPHVTIAGQIAIYSALLVGNVLFLWVLGTWIDDTERYGR